MVCVCLTMRCTSHVKWLYGKCLPHLALYISCEVAVWYILEVALHSFFMVHNIHVTVLVHPQFSNNNVMDCRCNLAPCIVSTCTTNNNVMDCGCNLAPCTVSTCTTNNQYQLQVPHLHGSNTLNEFRLTALY